MAQPDPASTPADYSSIGEQFGAGLLKVISSAGVQKAVTAGSTEAQAAARVVIHKALPEIGAFVGKAMLLLEEVLGPMFAGYTSAAVGHIFGTEVSASAFASHADTGGREQAAAGMVDAFLKNIGPDSETMEPGDAGARRFLNTALSASMEAWFSGFLLELITSIPGIEGLGHVKELGKLNEDVIGALGIPRLSRRVLGPIVDIAAVTPLKWHLQSAYRPELLTPASALRQFMRGAWEWADVNEELARHGYSDARIAALLNELRKFESVADVYLLQSTGALSNDEALQYLRDQGYDEAAAHLALRVEGQRRFKALETAEADALVAAFVDRRIEQAEFDDALAAHVPLATERALFAELATVKRAANVRHLSATQARELVKAGILAVPDYSAALVREGYVADAIDALELLLRKELDDKKTLEQHKKAAADEKAAAAAAKAAAAAAHKADMDAARALKQRGSIATLEDAYIRGLIPIDRLEAVLAAEFDADAVRVYVADVENKRQAYVTQQQRAADAAKRATNRGLSVGQLEQALVDGVLTVDEIRPQLADKGLSDGDVAVLLHVMQDAAAAKQRAAKLRAAADARAAGKTLSLAQAEALVKGGHWTVPQFDAFVATLGYDAADVLAINSLLGDALAKAKAAAAIVSTVAAGDGERGLTLAQMKRGVELGTVSIEAFQQYLVSQRYSAAAVATLVADAQDAANTAQAARARRDAAAPASDGRGVSLATLTRAAQLGILTPADYMAALQARGFSDADVALELDLLAAEIADAKAPTPAPGSAEATLAGAGDTPAAAAGARHVQVDGELAAKGLSLATVEKSVKAGDTTIESYTNWLEANGYGRGDAEILTSLLAAQLQG